MRNPSGEAAPNYRHGLCGTRLYRIWSLMKDRCTNPNSQEYRRYGGRGVGVCDEWIHNVKSFCDWAMANGYRDDLTIDRIDNDGNYCPENCRWVDMRVQSNNRRTNHFITHEGQTLTIAEWARRTGIPKEELRDRICRRGWECGKALTTPVKQKKLGGN